jgi:pyrroline-5-carboxylate reductase
MTPDNIAFIGGGNMARALIGGLCAAGHPVDAICVADTEPAARDRVLSDFGVSVTSDNLKAVSGATSIVLAVKPQIMPGVLSEICGSVPADALVISVAAGVKLNLLREGLGDDVFLVRAMPNTPALFGAGMTGLVASNNVSAKVRQQAEDILKAAGETVWLEKEALMDVVTAVSGSGPAYFFALAEQLALAGERAGLPAPVAAKLARQTAYGAGLMMTRSEEAPDRLREQVTSPGGTTAAALAALSKGNFEQLVDAAVTAAAQRSRELGGD